MLPMKCFVFMIIRRLRAGGGPSCTHTNWMTWKLLSNAALSTSAPVITRCVRNISIWLPKSECHKGKKWVFPLRRSIITTLMTTFCLNPKCLWMCNEQKTRNINSRNWSFSKNYCTCWLRIDWCVTAVRGRVAAPTPLQQKPWKQKQKQWKPYWPAFDLRCDLDNKNCIRNRHTRRMNPFQAIHCAMNGKISRSNKGRGFFLCLFDKKKIYKKHSAANTTTAFVYDSLSPVLRLLARWRKGE